MVPTSGTLLGPYKMAIQIGVSGMGEVYRAREQGIIPSDLKPASGHIVATSRST